MEGSFLWTKIWDFGLVWALFTFDKLLVFTFKCARNQDVEAFWIKIDSKIIYFVQLCLIALIVCDCTVYPDSRFLIQKRASFIFLRMEANFFVLCYHASHLQQIAVKFCVGCMVDSQVVCSNIEHLCNVQSCTGKEYCTQIIFWMALLLGWPDKIL